MSNKRERIKKVYLKEKEDKHRKKYNGVDHITNIKMSEQQHREENGVGSCIQPPIEQVGLGNWK